MTKALLLWPKTPETFWGFKHALKFINKKSSQPPLGLLTVASMLPKQWELKLVDLPIVRDRNVVTSTGPATAVDVALGLVADLTDAGNAAEIRRLMGFADDGARDRAD